MRRAGENIGALGVTKVGSRAVVQAGATIMVILGLFPAIVGVFAALPSPMIAGLYMYARPLTATAIQELSLSRPHDWSRPCRCLFGLITSTGLSQLQFIDLNSNRNRYILGFCLYNSFSLAGPAGYFQPQYWDAGNPFDNPGEEAAIVRPHPQSLLRLSLPIR